MYQTEKELISTGAKSQRKGRKAEIELSELLREHGIPAQVGDALNYGTQPDIQGVDGIHVECKRTEQIRLAEWMQQAGRDAKRFGDGLPAVFFRRSRSPWLVCMTLEDWMQIYKAQGCRCGGHCSTAETGEKRSSYRETDCSNHKG